MLKWMLKVFNPFIWLVNVVNYLGHLDIQARIQARNQAGKECPHCKDNYEPYDFSKDVKYF